MQSLNQPQKINMETSAIGWLLFPFTIAYQQKKNIVSVFYHMIVEILYILAITTE